MRIALQARRASEAHAKELDQARGLFDTLAQEAPIGIFYAGPDGVARYVNKSLARATGYPVGELIGALWSSKIYPQDRDKVTQKWLANVHSIEPWYDEFRFRKPD